MWFRRGPRVGDSMAHVNQPHIHQFPTDEGGHIRDDAKCTECGLPVMAGSTLSIFDNDN